MLKFVSDSNGHKVFDYIEEEPYLRLICSVYLDKHSSLYSNQTLHRFQESLKTPPLSKQLLAWGNASCIKTNAEWCHLVRAINFHNETPSKDHEAKLLPSFRALDQHRHRAEYVLHMVYSAPFRTCSHLRSFVAYGWMIDTDAIVWDGIPNY